MAKLISKISAGIKFWFEVWSEARRKQAELMIKNGNHWY